MLMKERANPNTSLDVPPRDIKPFPQPLAYHLSLGIAPFEA